MLQKYTYKNENGDFIFERLKLYKKCHRTWRNYDVDKKLPKVMLYNLQNVIKGIQQNKIIYFVTDEERVEALKRARHIATCFSNFCCDKDVLYKVLGIFKGATVYVVDDTFKEEKMKSNETQANTNFIEILTDVAQEVRILNFRDQRNDMMFDIYGDIISFFEDYYVTDIIEAKKSWRRLIKNSLKLK